MVTQELIDYLEEYFPNQLPSAEINNTQLSFLQGQQSVITRLKLIYEEDNGRITSPTRD